MGTLSVFLFLLALVSAIVARLVVNKRKGTSLVCGVDCASCPHCAAHNPAADRPATKPH
ncbi:MAG: FeoB-associated Cys-rich membrane protein [Christensenellaceae bacterium]|jgi:hypothetical protein|nr:FeoB-associated Cys-rich membrane protein [Christensenellaceae bacterium]